MQTLGSCRQFEFTRFARLGAHDDEGQAVESLAVVGRGFTQVIETGSHKFTGDERIIILAFEFPIRRGSLLLRWNRLPNLPTFKRISTAAAGKG